MSKKSPHLNPGNGLAITNEGIVLAHPNEPCLYEFSSPLSEKSYRVTRSRITGCIRIGWQPPDDDEWITMVPVTDVDNA